MSQNLAHLCALLIEDTYGPLSSHIFTALTSHGRLSARDISQKCHLPIRQVVASLAVLVQCLLVFHHTASDGRTSYQADPPAAFNLLRFGKYTQLMRHKFGRDGARILSHLLLFGHDSLENLRKLPAGTKEQGHSKRYSPGEKDDVMEDDWEHDQQRLQRLLKSLVEQGYLTELRPAHFQTWSDTWRAAEVVVKASGSLSSAKGKKGQEELEEAVRLEMGKRLHGESISNDATINFKRPISDDSEVPAPKKQKRVNGMSSEVTESGHVPSCRATVAYNDQTNFRLNYSKLIVILQHQMLVNRVRPRMGSQLAKVLGALLLQCEISPQSLGSPQQSSAVEAANIEGSNVKIDMSQLLLDLNAVNDAHVPENGEHIRNVGLTNGHVNGNLSHADERHLDLDDLDDLIAALTEGGCDFVFQSTDGGDWHVNLNNAQQRLRDDEIMLMIKRRFGAMSLRIVRILIDRGKVDEKALQEIGLFNAKDLRRCLAQLNAHGFIDLQEVPREKERQPLRTIFLWFYDPERVRKRVLQSLYKSMSRLLQRLKVERSEVSTTLHKAERSDVKGREHQMLRGDEINVLKRWRRRELWCLAELDRLGGSVHALQ